MQPSPTHPPGHNHGDRLNQALECHQLVEAEHFTGGHIQPMLGHDTYEERHGFMGNLCPRSLPAVLIWGQKSIQRTEGDHNVLSQSLTLGGHFLEGGGQRQGHVFQAGLKCKSYSKACRAQHLLG